MSAFFQLRLGLDVCHQDKQTTFDDALKELTWPLVVQSPLIVVYLVFIINLLLFWRFSCQYNLLFWCLNLTSTSQDTNKRLERNLVISTAPNTTLVSPSPMLALSLRQSFIPASAPLSILHSWFLQVMWMSWNLQVIERSWNLVSLHQKYFQLFLIFRYPY